MILGAGLFVPAPLVGVVAEALAQQLRRQPRADVALLALLHQAQAFAARVGLASAGACRVPLRQVWDTT